MSKGRCPTCGKTLSQKNLDKHIEKIRLSRSVEYGKLLDHLLSEINSVRDINLTDTEIYGFMKSTEEADEEMAIISMNQYIENNVASEGKGLPYLAAIINNATMTKKSKQEYEFKVLDRIPPKVNRG